MFQLFMPIMNLSSLVNVLYSLFKGKVVKSSGEDKLAIITFGVTVHESIKAHQILANESKISFI